MSRRPRLVKLHGSLPAQFPLIATEEDYRTYPIGFAPFVNTVQQSMMETVFCLIGFSGDDPNFLSWSGWVRDNLGSSAPKIYLAGWLNLSLHRRRMLEERNVVPVDLARHPKGSSWPENLKHHYATEWLLETLERGRPFDVTNWPTPPARRPKPVPESLSPVETVTSSEPRPEPALQAAQMSIPPEVVTEVTDIWQHNRKMYPGWLTVPSTKYGDTVRTTRAWGAPLLLSLERVGPVERLKALRELIWRQEVLLLPIRPGMESSIEETLNLFDCQERTIDGVPSPESLWVEIREAWRNTAATLVTTARFSFDHPLFIERIKSLSPFLEEDAELQNRILHERCLWSVYDMQFDELNDLLSTWNTDNCDPAWMMRKSALLWEAGQDREAEELLQAAISATRAMPADERSIAAQSRESWATLSAIRYHNRRDLLDRLRELASLRCDVFEDRQAVLEDMKPAVPDDEPRTFDINVRRGSVRFSNYDPQAAAYRAVRLAELTGQPPFAKDDFLLLTVWAEVMRKAAQQLSSHDTELAVRLVLRACHDDSDKALQDVLSRVRIANLETGQADRLSQACLRAIDHRLAHTTRPATAPRTTAAIEVLSRLVLRVSPGNVDQVLDRALEYCQDQRLASGTGWNAVENVLTRAWEAMPADDRLLRAFDLLNAPIAELDGPTPLGRFEWPDPAAVIGHSDTFLNRTAKNEVHWQASVDLVVRGLRSNPGARHRASNRLLLLVESKKLKQEEIDRLGAALWEESLPIPGSLPEGTGFADWAFLTLPAPRPEIAEQRIREKWLAIDTSVKDDEDGTLSISLSAGQGSFDDTTDLESRLWQIGNAIRSLQLEGREFHISDIEKQHLLNLVGTWAESRPPQEEFPGFDFFWQDINERTTQVASAVPAIIGKMDSTVELGEKLYARMQHQVNRQAPVFDLVPSLIRTAPARSTDIATALRLALTSSDRTVASGAARGVRLWLEESSGCDAAIPQPPEDLIREIGIAIATRRNAVIETALWTAQWIFEEGPQAHRDAVRDLVKTGLNYLATELNYDPARESPYDVPLRRILCAQLAMALAKDGHEGEPSVAHWIKMAKDDPFPEVRNAIAQ